MNHHSWVRVQFVKARRPYYRDVIIHASFIETVVRQLTQRNTFEKAIKALKRKLPTKEINQLDRLRKIRNALVHDLLKDPRMTNDVIKRKIYELRRVITDIYCTQPLIQDYFAEGYNINTRSYWTKFS